MRPGIVARRLLSQIGCRSVGSPTRSAVADDARWAVSGGVDFHEVKIGANVWELTIIFSDLVVTQLSDQIEDIVEHVPVWAERYWTPPAAGR